MTFTGRERYAVRLYGRPPRRAQLRNMDIDELLALANTALRDGDADSADAFYRYAAKQRRRLSGKPV